MDPKSSGHSELNLARFPIPFLTHQMVQKRCLLLGLILRKKRYERWKIGQTQGLTSA
jgi:hypothetical protein